MSGQDYAVAVGQRLRSVRRSQGLSLAAAAEKTGFGAIRIGSYERAQRSLSIEVLGDLCERYGVQFEEVVAGRPRPGAARQPRGAKRWTPATGRRQAS